MRTEVNNKHYNAKFNEVSDMKAKYRVTLKKEVFMKFFHILKLPGVCLMKINHDEMLEVEYSLEKSPFISVVLETPARNL